jgi:hypothetical protein
MNPPKMNANIYCNGRKSSSQPSAVSPTFTAKVAEDAKEKRLIVSSVRPAEFPLRSSQLSRQLKGWLHALTMADAQRKTKDQIIPDSFATFAPFAVNLFG